LNDSAATVLGIPRLNVKKDKSIKSIRMLFHLKILKTSLDLIFTDIDNSFIRNWLRSICCYKCFEAFVALNGPQKTKIDNASRYGAIILSHFFISHACKAILFYYIYSD